MTHDPRDALRCISVFPITNPLKNMDAVNMREIALKALTAPAPGEQQPVAHRIRVVDGSYCKVIPEGELEIWKQNWSRHLESGHASLEPLYTSAPPAAGWDASLRELESLAEKQKAYFSAKQRELPSIEDFTDGDGNVSLPDDITPLLNQAEANGRYSEADWWLSTIRAALRREAPASPRVSTTVSPSDAQTIINGIRLFGLAADGSDLRDLEATLTARPDAGGGVKEALQRILIEDDSDEADDECELCGGLGTVDAYTERTRDKSGEGRDEIGCPACIERSHSRQVRAALSNPPAAVGSNGSVEALLRERR